MFYFDKKIYYIDYYENGSRISNAGFISLTFKDEDCHVHVGIRNLPAMENRLCRWFGLINSEQVFLEEFRVEKGEADFVSSYKRNSLGRTEVDFSTLEGFYFALGKRRWGSCFFRNARQHMEPTFQEKPAKQTVQKYSYDSASDGNEDNKQYSLHNADNLNNEYSGEMNGNEESELYSGELNGNEESGFYSGELNDNEGSELYSSEMMDGIEEREPHNSTFNTDIKNDSNNNGTSGKNSTVRKSVHRTTWEELTETHQLVHPFEDQGDYISINPFTLKLLAPEYRKLANNSFLLHGFYNYRHLILGYYQDDERQGYYIGVPGTFDEREQMVAEMFGFEGYEPAGGVGYYMRKVEF